MRWDSNGQSWSSIVDGCVSAWKTGASGFLDSWQMGNSILSDLGKVGSLSASFNQGVMNTLSSQVASTMNIVRDPGAALSSLYADYKKEGVNPLCYALDKAVMGVYNTMTESYNNGFNYGANGFFYSLGQSTTTVAQTGISAYGGQILRGAQVKANAKKALKAFMNDNPNLNRTVIGAYDVQKGIYAIMHSSSPNTGYVNPTMFNKANKIGGFGVRSGNTIGACAEFKTAEILMDSGSQFRNIRFTNAYALKNNSQIFKDTCRNCKAMFKDQI